MLGAPVFFVTLALLGGVCARYAWDVVVIHTFAGAPHLNLAEAIGLSALVGHYTYNSTPKKEFGELMLELFLGLGVWMATTWLVHFWIPGA